LLLSKAASSLVTLVPEVSSDELAAQRSPTSVLMQAIEIARRLLTVVSYGRAFSSRACACSRVAMEERSCATSSREIGD
jgi:hypothetical protein